VHFSNSNSTFASILYPLDHRPEATPAFPSLLLSFLPIPWSLAIIKQMASPSPFTLSCLFRPARSLIRDLNIPQRRHARVSDIPIRVRQLTTHLANSRIEERYLKKLESKAKEEGLDSVQQLKEVYREKIHEIRRKSNPAFTESTNEVGNTGAGAGVNDPSAAAIEAAKAPVLQQTPPPVPTPQPAPTSSAGAAPGIKPLSSYLDLEKISALPAKEVEMIWRLRHASDPLSLCAVIPIQTYLRIYRTARHHPQFVLPLPRPTSDDGSGDVRTDADGFSGRERRSAADIHFLQWGFHPPSGDGATRGLNTHTSTVLFTHLAAFKVHGTYAQPHTTITHHLDLADSHGLVLLNGSVVKGRGVSVEEGRWLLMCLQKFYDGEGHGGGVGREKRQGLLRQFSSGDEGFNLEELVDEAERIS
jgi:ATP synthase mitochondrial F1 complex assembly factor 1